MTWQIDSIEFDPIERTKTIVEAMGEVIPELLGELSVEGNPYKIDLTDISTPAVYTLDVDVLDVETNIATTNNLTFTSLGTETVGELYTALIQEFNNTSTGVHFGVNLGYTVDGDKYFTVAAREGFAITSAVTLSTNITVSTESVAAGTGKPAAYLQYGKQQVQAYPHIAAVPIDHTEQNSRYGNGVVDVVGVGLRPYHEAYIKLRVSLRCESGGYQDVLSGRQKSASYILNRLKRKLGRFDYMKPFLEKVNAGMSPDWSFSGDTYIEGLSNKDAATAIVTFDLVDRYIELEGGVLEAVSFLNGEFYLNDQLQMTNAPKTVARPDYIP